MRIYDLTVSREKSAYTHCLKRGIMWIPSCQLPSRGSLGCDCKRYAPTWVIQTTRQHSPQTIPYANEIKCGIYFYSKMLLTEKAQRRWKTRNEKLSKWPSNMIFHHMKWPFLARVSMIVLSTNRQYSYIYLTDYRIIFF